MNPWLPLVVLALWPIPGLVVFHFKDREEMAKPVPYGDLPAVLRLNQWRVYVMVVSMLLGTFLMLWFLPQAVWNWSFGRGGYLWEAWYRAKYRNRRR
jgi:hypothetical protein